MQFSDRIVHSVVNVSELPLSSVPQTGLKPGQYELQFDVGVGFALDVVRRKIFAIVTTVKMQKKWLKMYSVNFRD